MAMSAGLLDRVVVRASGSQLVDRYLERLSPGDRAALGRLRKLVRAEAPEAVELLSYGMPAFQLNGVLLYYGAFTDHLSLFPASVATMRRFAREARPFASGRGTLRFTPAAPLPDELVRRLVRARVRENLRKERRRAAGGRGPARRSVAR